MILDHLLSLLFSIWLEILESGDNLKGPRLFDGSMGDP